MSGSLQIGERKECKPVTASKKHFAKISIKSQSARFLWCATEGVVEKRNKLGKLLKTHKIRDRYTHYNAHRPKKIRYYINVIIYNILLKIQKCYSSDA